MMDIKLLELYIVTLRCDRNRLTSIHVAAEDLEGALALAIEKRRGKTITKIVLVDGVYVEAG